MASKRRHDQIADDKFGTAYLLTELYRRVGHEITDPINILTWTMSMTLEPQLFLTLIE